MYKIELVGGDCNDCDLLRAAIDYLLRNMNTTFAGSNCIPNDPVSPQVKTCVTTWRAFIGGCWRTDWSNNTSLRVPCEPTQCCYAQYEVCRYADNLFVPRKIGGDAPSLDCTQYPSDCYQACGSLPDYGTQKPALIGSRQVSSEVLPNPSTGITMVSCAAGSHEKGVLNIYDAGGKVVLTAEQLRGKDERFRYFINVKPLPNGYYTFVISSDGRVLSTGKLDVVR